MQFRRKGKKKGTALRLTGLFKTKTRGLYVGSVEDLDPVKDKIRKAMADETGLVFFLWKNDPEQEGPPYTLSMDVSKDDDSYWGKGKPKRRPEPEDDGSDSEPESDEDSDDEPPF